MSLNSSLGDDVTLHLEANNVLHSDLEDTLKPGAYFEINDKIYQVVDLSSFDWWPYLSAKQVHPFDSVEIAFLPEEVLDNMIPESVFITRKVDQILNIPRDQIPPCKDYIIEYPYMDKEGKMHATMDDVRRANAEIYEITYPQKINNLDLITKIPESYFNKDTP